MNKFAKEFFKLSPQYKLLVDYLKNNIYLNYLANI